MRTASWILMALLGASVACAQDAAPASERHGLGPVELTLRDCIAIARVVHEDVLVARATRDEAKAGVDSAKAGQLPSLSLSLRAAEGETEGQVVTGGGTTSYLRESSEFDLYANFSWKLLDPSRGRLIDRAQLVEKQAVAGAEGVLRDLDVSVATAFVALTRAEQLLEVAREQAGLDAESVRMAEKRLEVGDGTELDIIQARAQAALSDQQLIDAENSVTSARLQLLSAMGVAEDPPDLLFVPEEPPVGLEAPPLPQCLDLAYGSRDDLRRIQHALDIARIDLRLADLGRRITYSLDATAYANMAESPSTTNWEIAFTATVPILDGGAGSASVRAAEARKIISEADLSKSLRTVWTDVTTRHFAWAAARELARASRVSEEAASRSLERTRAAYGEGAASYFDTLQAQLQYVEARQQRIQAEAQLLDALWRLERAAPGALPDLHPIETPDVEDLPLERPMAAPSLPEPESEPDGPDGVSTRQGGGAE